MAKTLAIGAPGDPQVQVDEKKAQADVDKPEVPTELDESVVRGVLKTLGKGANMVAHDEDVEHQWEFTDKELDGLTPPFTRYVNRVPKLREAVAKGDQLTIAVHLGSYIGRNFEDGRKAKKVRKEKDEQQGEASEPSRGARSQAGPGTGSAAVDAADRVAGGSPYGGGENR